MKSVLNVGGNNRSIALPAYFDGWQQVLLDIDPEGEPDLLMDARNMLDLPAGTYDAAYCSHNLEHFDRHDAPKVIRGMFHVIKPEGFVEARVPDIGQVMQTVVQKGLDLDDVLYTCAAGPILVRDAIWGCGHNIERMSKPYFAHRTGFTSKSLARIFTECGSKAYAMRRIPPFQLVGYFFLSAPGDDVLQALRLKLPSPFAG